METPCFVAIVSWKNALCSCVLVKVSRLTVVPKALGKHVAAIKTQADGAWVGISAVLEAFKNHMELLRPQDLEGDLCGR